MTDTAISILRLLKPHGPDNPISREQLRAELSQSGIARHIRDIQDDVADLQNAGEMIVSTGRGYFMPRGPEDIEQVRRAANIRRAHAQSELADASLYESYIHQLERPRRGRITANLDVDRQQMVFV